MNQQYSYQNLNHEGKMLEESPSISSQIDRMDLTQRNYNFPDARIENVAEDVIEEEKEANLIQVQEDDEEAKEIIRKQVKKNPPESLVTTLEQFTQRYTEEPDMSIVSKKETQESNLMFIPGTPDLTQMWGINSFWNNLKMLDSNNSKFLNIANAILNFVRRQSENAFNALIKMIQNEKNVDLNQYVEYILRKEDKSSFKVSKIMNKTFYMKDVNSFSLLRLAVVKMKLSQILVLFFDNLLEEVSYDNKISWSLDPFNSIRSSFSKGKTLQNLPTNSKTNIESACNFMRQHMVLNDEISGERKMMLERICPFDISAIELLENSNMFAFSPLREFLEKPDERSDPVFHAFHKEGGLIIGEGVWLQKKNTNRTISKSVKKLQPLQESLSKQLENDVSKSLLLKNISLYAKEKSQHQVSGQVFYLLVNNKMEKLEEIHFQSFSDVNQSGSFVSNFNIDHLLEKNTDFASNLIEKLINAGETTSGIIEPIVAVQNLDQIKNWSMYYKWEAYKGHKNVIMMMLMIKYMKSLADFTYGKEIEKLKTKVANGDKEAAYVYENYVKC